MRVPLGWLREFAPTDMGPEELAELITHRGVKVEGVLRPWEGLEGVVVVRVVEVRDHPGSDKLCVARIFHGSGETELVVGVRNMVAGNLVPWAPPGARVPALAEPLSVRPVRGVDSNGMLCSARELALSQDHGGILLLDAEGIGIGADLKTALGLDEGVFDIEVEPNRPDLLSVFGVAREVAAATGVPLLAPDLTVEEIAEKAADVATIRLDAPDGCPRYLARVIRGIEHRPSPLRAQARLSACGMRPIEAVVDATNYAMLELGQPLHGFDMDRLAGPGIVVRHARADERLTTLDDVERVLTSQDLLICDVREPVAIAGIMGGRTSEVSDTTSNVLLESAYFTRGGILLTARRLDLHTEASHRFERGTDPEGLDPGATRCAALIAAWAGGDVLAGAAEAGDVPVRRWVAMRPARASSLLGYDVTAGDAVAVFDVLKMLSRVETDEVQVEIPGYRTDLDREVDLIEEVVRIQGYDRVGSRLPRSAHAGGLPLPYAFAARVKDAFRGLGLREVRPAPFSSAEDLALFGDDDAVAVANPLRAEEGYMRTRLTPGLLRTVAANQSRGVERICVFEVGTTFRLAEPFAETRKAGFALAGPAREGWDGDRRPFDVLDAKGVLEAALSELGVRSWSLGDELGPPFHPGRSAEVRVGEHHAGVLGEIHPRVTDRLGIAGRVAVCVVGMASLMRGAGDAFAFHDVPRYPPVRRDLAFVLPEDARAGDVRSALHEAGGELLSRSTLFDVFRGGSLPEGAKSLAFSLEFRALDRTLTDEEAQGPIDRIVELLHDRFGAELRAG